VGFFSSIPTRNDTIIYDERIHTSIKDGTKLGLSNKLTFKHNDSNDLENKIIKSQGDVYVAVESVYSMDGDLAPLEDYIQLVKKYGIYLIVDEAHAVGLYGEKGEGRCVEKNVENLIFARIITFGKALGCHGACVVGSKNLKMFLMNHARSFIYSTALPPLVLKGVGLAYQKLENDPGLVGNYHNKLNEFKKFAEKYSLQNINESPIQGIYLKNSDKVEKLAEKIRSKGYFVRSMRPPTVPEGTERIRLIIHIFNTEKEIEGLLESIDSITSH
ncbi:MAG: aminotransferase class I/II-fold pyridoxal phosphate-dependent enzyme, partial [Flavobacteriales bacterium]